LLHRAHHIGLLSQERIPQICGPSNIVGQQPECVGKRYQGLDARVPVLPLGSVHQLSSLEVAVLPEPLLRLHDLQRIRARGQHLAEQRVGVQRNRRDQVIQLVRRQKRRRLLHVQGSRRRIRRALGEACGQGDQQREDSCHRPKSCRTTS
jgi:hypothetical protein